MSLRSTAAIWRNGLAGLLLFGCGDSGTGIGPPDSLDALAVEIVSGNNQEGVVAQELPSPLVVRVTDTTGRAVEGQVLNYVVTSGGGSVFAGTALTDADGRAQEFWTLGTSISTPQNVEVRAVNSTTGEKRVFGTFHATPRAGAAVRSVEYRPGYEISHPIYSAAGLPFRDTLGVKVFDDYDNPVAGASVSFGILTGGGSLAEEVVATSDSGVASASGWTFGAPGEQRLSVAVAGVSDGPTELFATAYPVAGRALVVNPADYTAPADTVVFFAPGVQGAADGDIYGWDMEDADSGELRLFRSDAGGVLLYPINAPAAGETLRLRVSVYGIGSVLVTITGT